MLVLTWSPIPQAAAFITVDDANNGPGKEMIASGNRFTKKKIIRTHNSQCSATAEKPYEKRFEYEKSPQSQPHVSVWATDSRRSAPTQQGPVCSKVLGSGNPASC